VDTQTRHALKEDKFVAATQQSLGWLEEHRNKVIPASIALVVALAVVIGGFVFYQNREQAASAAFGQAMQDYGAPLIQPGQQVPTGVKVYTSSAERAKAANRLFVDVANKYGFTPSGRNAEYFAGLTYMEMGQNASAEASLKNVSGSMSRNLAALAKLALAVLYQQTGRNSDAIALLKDLINKPATTVPAGVAKLQLAALYEASNQPEQAKLIYAALKDQDKTGAAGQIAAQKLGGNAQ
jgi:predicted negative regulator of RcsB-dependent stress response